MVSNLLPSGASYLFTFSFLTTRESPTVCCLPRILRGTKSPVSSDAERTILPKLFFIICSVIDLFASSWAAILPSLEIVPNIRSPASSYSPKYFLNSGDSSNLRFLNTRLLPLLAPAIWFISPTALSLFASKPRIKTSMDSSSIPSLDNLFLSALVTSGLGI